MFYGKSFSEVRSLHSLSKFRELMSEALIMSIHRLREMVSYELLMFSKSRLFPMIITENEVQILVQNKMYDLIEELIFTNSLLRIEARRLDIDQVFEAHNLRVRQKKIDEEAPEFEEDSIGNFEGGDKSKRKSKDNGETNQEKEVSLLIQELEQEDKKK